MNLCAIAEPRKWLYGYVFYRQSRDASIHRGYLQKSIVILSENNLVDFYQRVIAVIGETYFDYGEKALDMAWRDILSWPTPQLSHHLSFPLLGKVIKFPMPSIRNGAFIFTPLPSVLDGNSKSKHKDISSSASVSSSSNTVSNSKSLGLDGKISTSSVSLDDRFLHTVPIYAPLAPIISKIWLLWELVLLGQPILVLSPQPSLSSDAVLALASIISPLEFKGDFRPFFTINDHDFKAFSDDTISVTETWSSGLIVGGTNPYFSKALAHWKNIITLEGRIRTYKHNPFLIPTTTDSGGMGNEGANRSLGLIDYSDHVQCSSYKPVFPAGPDLKKHLKHPSKSESFDDCYNFNEKFVRYHLHLRTTTFLAPLRHFFDRLVASKAQAFKPFSKIPVIGELSATTIAAINTHLAPGRQDPELKFYERFVSTSTFKRWFNKKRKIANDKLASDYSAFLVHWKQSKPFEGLGEMELVNMYQDALDQLKREQEALGAKGTAAVKSVVEDLVKCLDPDLQAAIRMKSEIGVSKSHPHPHNGHPKH